MFEKRILAACVSVFAIGVVFGLNVSVYAAFISCAVLTVISLLLVLLRALCRRREVRRKADFFGMAAIAVAVFMLGVFRMGIAEYAHGFFSVYDGVRDVVTVKVTDRESSAEYGYITGRVSESGEGVAEGSKVRIYLSDGADSIRIGDTCVCSVVYSETYGKSLLADGVDLSADGSLIGHTDGSGLLYGVRNGVSENCETMFHEDAAAVAKAVTVGDKSGLSSYHYAIYRNAGISHILAISGLHITLIIMSVYFLLRLLSVGMKVRGTVCVILAILYAALVNFTPSAVRAVFMLSAVMIGRMVLFSTDTITVLFIAFAVLLLINPFSLLSLSLQLSFICCLGLLLVSSPINKLLRKIKGARRERSFMRGLAAAIIGAVLTPAAISFFVAVCTFPVLYSCFDTVSYIAPLVNIVAVPLFSYALGFILAASVVFPLSPVAAGFIAYPAEKLLEIINGGAKLLYDADAGSFSMHMKYMWVPLAAAFLVIAALLFIKHRRILVASLTSAVFVLSLVGCSLFNVAWLSERVIAETGVGTAEYVYLSCNRENIYVDTGGRRVESEAVLGNGETSIDAFVLKSLDESCVSKTDDITGILRVECIIMPNPVNPEENDRFNQIKQLANERNCAIINYDDMIEYRLSSAKFAISLKGSDVKGDLLCFDAGNISIRFFSEGYDACEECDIAVLTGAVCDSGKPICKALCVPNGISADFKSHISGKVVYFDKRLHIEYRLNESESIIYES